MTTSTNKITPCLWVENPIEEVLAYYMGIFSGGKVIDRQPGGPDGGPLTAIFEIEGFRFMLLNGGPYAKYTEAVSFSVDCEDQAEVDRYWTALIADGGAESMCGWCKDKYGLSWQIVPKAFYAIMTSPDTEGVSRATQAMFKMKKLIVADLEKAYAGA